MSSYYTNDPEEAPAKPKPMIHLESEEFDEITDWEVGETYTVLVKIKQTNKNESEDGGVRGSFEIVDIKELPKKSDFSKDEVKVALNMRSLDHLR